MSLVALKVCSGCNETKESDKFYPDSKSKSGLRSRCIDCCERYRKESKNNPALKHEPLTTKETGIRKHCPGCDKTKDLEDFQVDRRLKYGRRSKCKVCVKEYTDSPQVKAKVQSRYDRKKWKDGRLKRQYGITIEEFEEMLEEQNYTCLICPNELLFSDKGTHVDHCHITGKVRGILCHGCNTGLGSFKEDIGLLQNAINYLKMHQEA